MKIEPRVPEETADNSRGSSSPRRFWVNTALVIGFFAALYFGLGFASDGIVHFMPLSWEERLEFTVPDAWDQEFPVPEKVSAVFKRVVDRSGSYREFHLHILPDGALNAYAFPGGNIGITTGLVEVIGSEEALAFVIAHEIGHFEHRHLLKKLSRAVVFGLAKSILFGNDTGTAPLNRLDSLGDLNYSRRQERQADTFALDCLNRTYGHVGGATAFFEMIEYKGLRVQLLDTHPLPGYRIEQIEALIRKHELTVEPVTRLPRE